VQKTRFISFIAPPATQSTVAAGAETAIRVRLVSLHHVNPPYTAGPTVAFTAFEGDVLWAGPPQSFIESTSNTTRFVVAQTSCIPHYRDWSEFLSCTNAIQLCNTDADCPGGGVGTCSNVTANTVHITGSGIVPSSTFLIENVGAACQGSEPSCAIVSSPLQISTTRWGDVEIPYNPPSPTTQPDLGDIGALVNKFRSALGAPIKARAYLAGTDAWGNVTSLGVNLGFDHIAVCVDAFRGAPYPYKMGKCAGAPTPPATGACTTSGDCVGTNGAGPCNLYCP
jgi:hypothetical protein